MRGQSGSSSSSTWRRHDNSEGVDLHKRCVIEAEEKERQWLEWERAFDAGLIRSGGSIAPEVGIIVLVNHLEKVGANWESTEVL